MRRLGQKQQFGHVVRETAKSVKKQRVSWSPVPKHAFLSKNTPKLHITLILWVSQKSLRNRTKNCQNSRKGRMPLGYIRGKRVRLGVAPTD